MHFCVLLEKIVCMHVCVLILIQVCVMCVIIMYFISKHPTKFTIFFLQTYLPNTQCFSFIIFLHTQLNISKIIIVCITYT